MVVKRLNMQTTYRLNTQEINSGFVKSIKALFGNQEVEINVKTTIVDHPMNEKEWLTGMSKNPSFDFLHEEPENVYSLEDGIAIVNEK